ncbi:MAG TPA: hypothetical protein VMT61_15175 [Candidatus Binataceae bacterium]|nr:hypothetical protein [Candidatus Binataceae bacterium]
MKTNAARTNLIATIANVASRSMVIVGALLIASLGVGVRLAAAQVSPPGAVYQVSYFDVGATSGAGVDNRVRIVNPTSANGNLCAMLYVFNDNEEMQECCGCPLTPNDLLSLSVYEDLTSNPWGADAVGNFSSGVIDVVSALPNRATSSCNSAKGCFGGCDPTSPYRPTAELESWITHADVLSAPVPVAPIGTSVVPTVLGTSTTPFSTAAYDQVQKNYLVNTCNLLVNNGSGVGVCTCGELARSTTVIRLQ